jgi:hypothetical protein
MAKKKATKKKPIGYTGKSRVYRTGTTGKRKMTVGNVVQSVEPDKATENYNKRRKASAKKTMDDKSKSNKKRLAAGREVARHSMSLAAQKGLKKRDNAKAKKKTSAAKRYQNQK